MKKIMSGLVALLLSAGMGCNSCVPSTQPPRTMTREYVERNKDGTLEALMNSSYCVRTEVDYKPISGKNRTMKWFGSSLAYKQDRETIYFLTNKHVVSGDDIVLAMGKDGVPMIYQKQKETSYITGHTCKKTGGIKATEVIKSGDVDAAIIKAPTDGTIHPTHVYKVSPIESKVDDEIFAVGFPKGMFQTVTRGRIVATNVKGMEKFPYDALDITSTFGSSGSPYFIKRGNKFYFGGILTALNYQPHSHARLFSFGTKRDKVDELVRSNGGW